MNKIMNILMVAIVFAAVSCDYNSKNFPGYNDSNTPKDIKTLEYTMTDDDYNTVANNSTNKGLAKADGKEAELKEIETQKAFNAIITAEKYAPALVALKFPTLDEGSAVRLTYNYKNVANTPLYIDTLSHAGWYNLNKNDYDTAYSTSSDTTYFKSVAQANSNMSKILKGKFPTAPKDSMLLVTYDVKISGSNVSTATLWKNNGTAWTHYNNSSVYVMQKADYTTMNIKYDNFSGTQADTYLPAFLKNKYPYATKNKKVGIAYKFFNSGKTTVRADEYAYDGTNWAKTSNISTEKRTDQFVKHNGKWMYNPSVTINLPPIRNDAVIMAYYQAAVDWVWENIDKPAGCTTKGQGYVTSFGNNDYYGGMSAFFNNVDMRPDKARDQVKNSTIDAIKNAYPASMTDEQVEAKMTENLIAELNGMLQKKHPEAAPVEGIDVIYTINIPIFKGTPVEQNTHTIQYKVVGQGKFEYVDGSLKPIK